MPTRCRPQAVSWSGPTTGTPLRRLPQALMRILGTLRVRLEVRGPKVLRRSQRAAVQQPRHARLPAVRRDRLARDDIHPVSSDLGDLGVAIALDWRLR